MPGEVERERHSIREESMATSEDLATHDEFAAPGDALEDGKDYRPGAFSRGSPPHS